MVDNPIKIAILDTGVASSLFPRVIGKSFVEDSARTLGNSLWHTVQNSHGTEMASLIYGMNPNCIIYAARTHNGTESQGVDVQAAIKVILFDFTLIRLL